MADKFHEIVKWDKIDSNTGKLLIEEARRRFDDMVAIYNKVDDKSQRLIVIFIPFILYLISHLKANHDYAYSILVACVSIAFAIRIQYGQSTALNGHMPSLFYNKNFVDGQVPDMNILIGTLKSYETKLISFGEKLKIRTILYRCQLWAALICIALFVWAQDRNILQLLAR